MSDGPDIGGEFDRDATEAGWRAAGLGDEITAAVAVLDNITSGSV